MQGSSGAEPQKEEKEENQMGNMMKAPFGARIAQLLNAGDDEHDAHDDGRLGG